MATQYNIVDLFSGAGGISCGFEMMGFNTLLGVDFDKYAIETFKYNHPKAESYCGDIRKLSTQVLKKLTHNKKIHVVVGGPPCQGFSTVGLGNPKDDRNHLFLEFCRIVSVLDPEFVVMENVTGLLAKKNEKTLLSIFQTFKKMGYETGVRVLSAHHFGVPEKRKRTVIIASRTIKNISFPLPTHDVTLSSGKYIAPITLGDVFSDLKKQKNLVNHDLKFAKVKTDIDLERIKMIPEGKSIRYEEDEKAYFKNKRKKLSLKINWEKLPENRLRQAKYLRLSRKQPSPTILTHRHTYFHPVEDRYLTAREAATLQSFPFHFEFQGPISSQWRQIGNAVPPLLAKAIATHLLKLFKQKNVKSSKVKMEKNLDEIRSSAFRYN